MLTSKTQQDSINVPNIKPSSRVYTLDDSRDNFGNLKYAFKLTFTFKYTSIPIHEKRLEIYMRLFMDLLKHYVERGSFSLSRCGEYATMVFSSGEEPSVFEIFKFLRFEYKLKLPFSISREYTKLSYKELRAHNPALHPEAEMLIRIHALISKTQKAVGSIICLYDSVIYINGNFHEAEHSRNMIIREISEIFENSNSKYFEEDRVIVDYDNNKEKKLSYVNSPIHRALFSEILDFHEDIMTETENKKSDNLMVFFKGKTQNKAVFASRNSKYKYCILSVDESRLTFLLYFYREKIIDILISQNSFIFAEKQSLIIISTNQQFLVKCKEKIMEWCYSIAKLSKNDTEDPSIKINDVMGNITESCFIKLDDRVLQRSSICFFLDSINDYSPGAGEYTSEIDIDCPTADFLCGKKYGKTNRIAKVSGCILRMVTVECSGKFHRKDRAMQNYVRGQEYDHSLHDIKNTSGYILNNRPVSGNLKIQTRGTLKQTVECLKLLRGELPTSTTFYVDDRYHRQIIGVRGRAIQSIMGKYDVYVRLMNTRHGLKGDGSFFDTRNSKIFENYEISKSENSRVEKTMEPLVDNTILQTPLKNIGNLDKIKNEILNACNSSVVSFIIHEVSIFENIQNFPFRKWEMGYNHIRIFCERWEATRNNNGRKLSFEAVKDFVGSRTGVYYTPAPSSTGILCEPHFIENGASLGFDSKKVPELRDLLYKHVPGSSDCHYFSCQCDSYTSTHFPLLARFLSAVSEKNAENK